MNDDGGRVLIAEDDPSIRRMLTALLGRRGYRTTVACDGGEALEAMRAGEADLVVLDLKMPRINGWEVLTERAAEPELRKIPIIVITAERGESVADILDLGICALLPKPFDLDALLALVKSCLDGAEGEAEPLTNREAAASRAIGEGAGS